MVERTNSLHIRGFGLLQVVLDLGEKAQQACTHLANAIIALRHLLKETWTRFRWHTRPVKQYFWR